MTLMLNIAEELTRRLEEGAHRLGLETSEYARQIIESNLPSSANTRSLPELFAQWDAEDATNDPAEIAARNEEFEQFKQAMNKNREECEGYAARKLYP
jgi:hypothetical protein